MEAKTLQELYDYLAGRFGFDAQEWENRRSLNLGMLHTYKSLLNAYNLLQTGNETLALVELNCFVIDEEKALRKFTGEPTEEALADFAEGIRVAARVKELYAKFKNDEYTPLLQQFYTKDLYAEDEINPATVAPEHFLNLNSIKDIGYFKGRLRSAEDESETIDEDIFDYQLASNIIVTDSISRYLGKLNLSSVTKVAMFFVIEEPVAYSYFAFVIQYKGYIWLYSDAIDYVNPTTKASSRNPWRKVEDKLGQVWLPYDQIFNNLAEWQSSANLVENGKERSQFYSKEIKSFFSTIEKLYVQTLISLFLQDIRENKPMKRALTVGEFINSNRLLSTGELTMDAMGQYEEAQMIGWKDEVKERYQDILVGLGMSQELIKVNPANFIERLSTWITTPDKFQNLLVWSALEDQRKVVHDKMHERFGGYGWGGEYGGYKENKEDEKKLRDMLNKALTPILAKLSAYERLKWVKGPNLGFGSGGRDGKPTKWDCLDIRNEKPGSYWSWGYLHIGVNYDRKKVDDYCNVCRTHRHSFRVRFTAHHYRHLMWLLDCGRFDLPQVYRNYNTHDIYVGNSILNNVHPLALVEDPLSDRELPNGMRLDFYCCKTCWNKLRKENFQASERSLNKVLEEAGV
jgi:hypothetical protein